MAKAKEGYISKAILRDTRVSPRKARLVVDMVRGARVERALEILNCCDKKTAPVFKKLLLSAVANAREQSKVDVDELFIRQVWVDTGRTFQRIMPRARGSATPIKKRHSTITVVLDEIGAM
jgi:large subunit ribosomal protein L22